jgi:hypothetical protein
MHTSNPARMRNAKALEIRTILDVPFVKAVSL